MAGGLAGPRMLSTGFYVWCASHISFLKTLDLKHLHLKAREGSKVLFCDEKKAEMYFLFLLPVKSLCWPVVVETCIQVREVFFCSCVYACVITVYSKWCRVKTKSVSVLCYCLSISVKNQAEDDQKKDGRQRETWGEWIKMRQRGQSSKSLFFCLYKSCCSLNYPLLGPNTHHCLPTHTRNLYRLS